MGFSKNQGGIMGVSLIGSASSIKNVTIATTSVGEPDWSYIPTAGKSGKSKEEFISEIRELAKKAALAGSKSESEQLSIQVTQLRAEYLSEVAPDRKGLYQHAKNQMKNQNGNPKCKGTGELTLLDFLEAAKGRESSLAEKRFALSGGGILTCPMLTGGGYGAEIEYQGVKVLSNTGYGWGYELTPAELARKDEFYAIYWKEYRAVKNDVEDELAQLPDYLGDRPAFDRKA